MWKLQPCGMWMYTWPVCERAPMPFYSSLFPFAGFPSLGSIVALYNWNQLSLKTQQSEHETRGQQPWGIFVHIGVVNLKSRLWFAGIVNFD
uniref:Uncharacterized protein n=1 Tax=Zea mays TaxID=4577 RepID=C4J2I3_MAIZE|nr:unknown [Zea mays]